MTKLRTPTSRSDAAPFLQQVLRRPGQRRPGPVVERRQDVRGRGTPAPGTPSPSGNPTTNPRSNGSSTSSWPAARVSSRPGSTGPNWPRLNGQTAPDSILEGKRFAFMERFTKVKPKLLGPKRKFARHGQSGTWVSEVFPHMAKGRGRRGPGPIGGDRELQSCSRQALLQHRIDPLRDFPAWAPGWVTDWAASPRISPDSWSSDRGRRT